MTAALHRRVMVAVVGLALIVGVAALFGVHWSERKVVSSSHSGAASALPTVSQEPRDIALPSPKRATWSGLNLMLTDVNGAKVVGGRVCLLSTVPETGTFNAFDCKVSETGEFQWVGAAGPQWIVATALGFAALTQPVNAPANLTLKLQSGRFTAEGVVDDASGGAIADAFVTGYDSVDGKLVGAAWSDDQGQFSLTTSEQHVRVVVDAHGYMRWRQDYVLPASGIRAVLGPGAAVRGRVVMGSSGEPLAGVPVVVTGNGGVLPSAGSTSSGADGTFFIGGLNAGKHIVEVADSEWVVVSPSVELQLGTSQDVLLQAERAARARLSLTVAGKPCIEGKVQLVGPTSNSGVEVHPGVVVVERLQAGTYMASIRCNAAVNKQVELSILGGEELSKSIDLDAGFSLAGDVFGVLPSEQGKLLVRIYQPDGPYASECAVASDGHFVCQGLVPETYEYAVFADDSQLTEVSSARIVDTDLTGARLVLPARGDLVVTLRADDGSELPNLTPSLKGSSTTALVGSALGKGRFQFSSIPAGHYTVGLAESAEQARSGTVYISHGDTQELDWVLATGTIEGQVLDADGMAQPDVWVSAHGDSSLGLTPPDAMALTDLEGRFELKRLARERYQLRAEGAAGYASQGGVAVPATVDIVLTKLAGGESAL